jgi:hypothetical protein
MTTHDARLRFVQTSDCQTYLPMLRSVERTCIPFCHKNDILYHQFIGLSRGCRAWHATFNRICLLREAWDGGHRGWLLYADADCYVHDLDFPVYQYLADHAGSLLIVTTGGDERRWAVNAGVFCCNMRHALAAEFIHLWHDRFHAEVTDAQLADPAVTWDNCVNDQDLLHGVLRDRPDILAATTVDDGSTLNYRGRFIRQALRAYHAAMPARLAYVEQEIASIMSAPDRPAQGATTAPPTLTALADTYGSDKGTRHGAPPHRYTYLYDLLFHPFRHREINFLELGLAVGGPETGGPVDRRVMSPSVKMWLTYFPRATIFGFDISDFSQQSDPRFHFVRGDAASADDLGALADTAEAFDIIIDDASHASYHQQLAFKHLFRKLEKGGLYIIEDLHWQSPAFEDREVVVPKTFSFFNEFFEAGRYLGNPVLSSQDMAEVKAAVQSYAWFGAFDGSASAAKLLVLRKID